MKFKALYPTDKMNFMALLEDGTLVRLLSDATQTNFTIHEVGIDDKRPQEPKRKTMYDAT